MKVDYLLKSRAIFDSVKDEPFSGGIAVTGDKIVGVIPEKDLHLVEADAGKVIDYGDRLIMPGLIDSHTHTGMAMDYVDESYCVDISPAKTFPDIMKMMQEFGERYPDNKVVFGINFNFFNLDEYFVPTAKAMDEYFPDRPAMIMTWDVHTYYANTAAIQLAGITRDTPDPNNGIGKDEDGELNGTFNDTAAFAIQEILERPFEERKGSLLNFQSKLNQCGITSVGDVYPCGNTKPYPLYKEMEDQLTLRIHFYPELLSFTPEGVREYQENFNSPMLQFAGLKNLIDGVLTVHTAWMLEPYTNAPETAGFPAVPAEEVRQKMLEAISMGINVRIHTIGDKAVRYVLDVFEEAEKKYGRLKRRHNMEHLEYADPADIPRFAELGIVANMHFRHCIFYIDDAIKYLGPERVDHCFQWRTFKDSGAIMGTGSDFPVVSFNPWLGVYAGITRQLDDGYPEGGWMPEQRLTLAEVLQIYTYGGAQALNRDQDLGTLEVGKLADITVLDRNPFAVEPKEILQIQPVMTMVNGRIVHER